MNDFPPDVADDPVQFIDLLELLLLQNALPSASPPGMMSPHEPLAAPGDQTALLGV